MIVDSIKNTDCGNYPEAFKKVFEYFKTLTRDTPDGTVELDGRKVYVMVQSGETAGDTAEKMELHRKYIDIQYVIDGSEGMICAIDDGKMNVVHPYDDEKDYCCDSHNRNVSHRHSSPLFCGRYYLLYLRQQHTDAAERRYYAN